MREKFILSSHLGNLELMSAARAMRSEKKKINRFREISEKAMATHSSTLARKIPWTEEPGGLQSMGSRRVGRD